MSTASPLPTSATAHDAAYAGSPILDAQQLLAMPASAYMNAVQLAFFRHLLRQQQAQLLANAQYTGAQLRQYEDAADPADRATQEEAHALELRTRDRKRKHLKKIAAALARIETGDYGYCQGSGEPIGLARLLAGPSATLCIEAQERHERRERQFSH